MQLKLVTKLKMTFTDISSHFLANKCGTAQNRDRRNSRNKFGFCEKIHVWLARVKVLVDNIHIGVEFVCLINKNTTYSYTREKSILSPSHH